MYSRSREPSLLELEVERAIRSLLSHEVGSKEYAAALDAVMSLHKMKEDEKPFPVSKDTLILVATNLLGIIMILKHEHVNVITSRAMNLVIKPK